ncbi:1-aminocyclopropane-1-carboxylate deaminase/D-cysteine desulfhydrase [Fulvivirgaceae bacterium LMO-SS25]
MPFTFSTYQNPPIVKLNWHKPISQEIYILREDLSHPEYGGNKYWKLKGNIEKALADGYTQIITAGGAYSNHIYAAAALCAELNLPCIGLIRGEEHQNLNPTLAFAQQKGMKLHYVDRQTYRQIREEGLHAIQALTQLAESAYYIPEGGSSIAGVQSCADWAKILPDSFDLICHACGTGGSLAGLAGGKPNQAFMGFSVLKGNFMAEEITNLQLRAFGKVTNNWQLQQNFHFGGYARMTDELMDFVRTFYHAHNILLDPIYTSKMLFGIDTLLAEQKLEAYKRILIIHSGGLQGWAGKELF